MDNVGLHILLQALADQGEQYVPGIKDDLRNIIAAVEASKETTNTGGLTRRAHQMLQRLRNPFFETTHEKKARQALNRLTKKTHAKLVAAITEVAKSFGVHQQALLELSLLDVPGHVVEPSREDEPVKDWKDLGRLADAMEARGVPLYLLGRLRDHEYDLFGELVLASRDREYADPENYWNRLFHSGFFDAFRKDMSEDEARLLAEVDAHRGNVESLRLRDQLETRLGRPLSDIRPDFAAACELLVVRAGELSFGEANALVHASGEQRSKETESLCKFLAIPVEESIKIQATMGYLATRTLTSDDYELQLALHSITIANEAFEQSHVPYDQWLPGLAKAFGSEESFVGKQFRDPAGFWALYEYVLTNSETFRRLTAERRRVEEADRQASYASHRAYFDQMGIAYDVDEWGIPVPLDEIATTDQADDAEFHEIDEANDAADGDDQPPGQIHDGPGRRLQLIHTSGPAADRSPEHPQSDLFGDSCPSRSSNVETHSKYGDLE